MLRIQYLKSKLELQPHPEGGFFRETYRSSGIISSTDLGKNTFVDRNYSTCIYFLLTSDTFSAFHRIRQDEVWHFYEGSPIELHMISKNGEHSRVLIGSEIENGHIPQFVVPAGRWFAAKIFGNGDYALIGCTVSPGFDFDDFELGRRRKLVKRFPAHEVIINAFTRD